MGAGRCYASSLRPAALGAAHAAFPTIAAFGRGKDTHMSKALTQGLQTLELLAEAPRSAAEVARHLCVDRSTGWRILQVLSEHGWVRQDGDSKTFSLNVTH